VLYCALGGWVADIILLHNVGARREESTHPHYCIQYTTVPKISIKPRKKIEKKERKKSALVRVVDGMPTPDKHGHVLEACQVGN
jgi:hypothetical protein